MDWLRLISNKRLGQEDRHPQRHDDRSEFKRDSDRLVYSAAFRRLQNKTQVFPLPGSIFVHNRLTHSLEVSSLGKSLGDDVARELTKRHPELRGTLFEEIGTIVQTAGLAHDMGNPPLATVVRKPSRPSSPRATAVVSRAPCRRACGRTSPISRATPMLSALLTHRFRGRRPGGFVMTYSTLASIVKYPFSSLCASRHGKFGFFRDEQEYFRRVADDLGMICLDPSADTASLRPPSSRLPH